MVFFFFKQKTAYEIGLGIPAEPLFRSSSLFLRSASISGYDATPFNQILKQNAKREMRLRLGKVTVADVLAAQPVTTKIGRASCRERVEMQVGAGPLRNRLAEIENECDIKKRAWH